MPSAKCHESENVNNLRKGRSLNGAKFCREPQRFDSERAPASNSRNLQLQTRLQQQMLQQKLDKLHSQKTNQCTVLQHKQQQFPTGG